MFFASCIHTLFSLYTTMLVIEIISSWFSELEQFALIRWNKSMTEPYLQAFRKIIPPIGGVFDITPIIAFFVLQILENSILRILFS